MPGLNYGLGTAAFIPPEGIVLEAIDPAKYAKGQVLRIAQYLKKKDPAQNAGQGTHRLKTVAWTLPRSSAVTTPQNGGNVKKDYSEYSLVTLIFVLPHFLHLTESNSGSVGPPPSHEVSKSEKCAEGRQADPEYGEPLSKILAFSVVPQSVHTRV